MAVGIFVTGVENTPTDRAVAQQQLDQMLEKLEVERPSAPRSRALWWLSPEGLGEWVFRGGTIPWAAERPPHLRLRQRVLSSATPSVLGDFTHHSIKK